MRENLRYRQMVLREAKDDRKKQSAFRAMCREDSLFWMGTFCWTFNPMAAPKPVVIPFIPYEGYQDEAIIAIEHALDDYSMPRHDVAIEKSRNQGASWICLAVFLHRFLFQEMISGLLASRKKDYVDEKGNSDSLFWKLRFMLDRMPSWLRPRVYDKEMHLENLDNGSLISGETTNENLGRGGRRAYVFLDEFAAFDMGFAVLDSVNYVTNHNIFNSTHQGPETAFNHQCKLAQTRLRMHWSTHPEQRRGMYTSEAGVHKQIDDTYTFPDDYEYRHDGKLRSPYYDFQEKACGFNKLKMGRELDIDPGESGGRVYPADGIETHRKANAEDPWREGEIIYDSDTLEPIAFEDRPHGNLKLWMNLDPHGKPPLDVNYSAGADIAAGTGASNSAIVFGDEATRQKVAEYVTPHQPPETFAKTCIALCKWFGDAFFIWERNGGPGAQFTHKIMDERYPRVYFQTDDDSVTRKQSLKPGFWSNAERKSGLLGEHRDALVSGTYVEKSHVALNECLQYMFGPDGRSVYHVKSKDKDNPSGAGEAHGDVVIATSLMVKAMKGKVHAARPEEKQIPEFCMMSRRKEWERKQRRKRRIW